MTPIDPAVAWTGVRGVHDGSRRDLARFQRRLSAAARMTLAHF